MNRKKLVSTLIIGIILLLQLVGCQNNRIDIGEPPVQMKTVVQNSQGDLITYEFQLPEKWFAYEVSGTMSVGAYTEADRDIAYYVDANELLIESSLESNEQTIESFKALFGGRYEEFEKSFFGTESDFLENSSDNYEYDIQYKHYNGTYGKISEVQYRFELDGKTYDIIHCIREDLFCSVTGAFDESLDLSSGEIALWVADSLKVTEHFKLEDGVIVKED